MNNGKLQKNNVVIQFNQPHSQCTPQPFNIARVYAIICTEVIRGASLALVPCLLETMRSDTEVVRNKEHSRKTKLIKEMYPHLLNAAESKSAVEN